MLNFFRNALLVVVSTALALLVVEGILRVNAAESNVPLASAVQNIPPAGSLSDIPPAVLAKQKRHRIALILPDAWAHKPVTVEGARNAFLWHGALHVENADRMRRTTPFPEKREDTYRVMVVGDSLTYGYGVAEEDTFVALLNQWLSREYRIEFLNLGTSAYQSEDILRMVQEWTPRLKPNLVIYGICTNDFLPSGEAQYWQEGYDFPLSDDVKRWLIKNTKVGELTATAYDKGLRALRLRKNYYDDILKDFSNYQSRFRRNLMEMNLYVTRSGLPPLIGMALNQDVKYGEKGHQITQAAELHLRQVGAEVIDTEDYYLRYNMESLVVSRWDGHPNEVAHYIWARMIAERLRARGDIAAFQRKDGSAP